MKKIFVVLTMLAMCALAVPAAAQNAEPNRTVGRKGAKQLSLSFATMTQISTAPDSGFGGATSTSTNIFGAVGFGRFVTERFVLNVGISGSGDVQEGSSPMFFTSVGGLFYFSPQRVSSAYIGGDVSTMISTIEGVDSAPEVLGKLGVQTAIKENAAIFFEGAYGGAIKSFGSSGSLRTQLGLRVLF
jgi:hypothetical protein